MAQPPSHQEISTTLNLSGNGDTKGDGGSRGKGKFGDCGDKSWESWLPPPFRHSSCSKFESTTESSDGSSQPTTSTPTSSTTSRQSVASTTSTYSTSHLPPTSVSSSVTTTPNTRTIFRTSSTVRISVTTVTASPSPSPISSASATSSPTPIPVSTLNSRPHISVGAILGIVVTALAVAGICIGICLWRRSRNAKAARWTNLVQAPSSRRPSTSASAASWLARLSPNTRRLPASPPPAFASVRHVDGYAEKETYPDVPFDVMSITSDSQPSFTVGVRRTIDGGYVLPSSMSFVSNPDLSKSSSTCHLVVSRQDVDYAPGCTGDYCEDDKGSPTRLYTHER